VRHSKSHSPVDMPEQRLIDDLMGLATVKAPEVAQWAADKNRAAIVAFSMGAQWALELAALDPEVALRLVRAIHDTQTQDTANEWNNNALVFIKRAHEQAPPPTPDN
jgi:pimeloyl-ACP methyl ester carboxylesterase